jgi:ankyrin repeat protein
MMMSGSADKKLFKKYMKEGDVKGLRLFLSARRGEDRDDTFPCMNEEIFFLSWKRRRLDALEFAIHLGMLEVCDVLLEFGASAPRRWWTRSIIVEKCKRSQFRNLVEDGKVDAVRSFLTARRNERPDERLFHYMHSYDFGREDFTALEWAAACGMSTMCKVLLEFGADPEQYREKSPLCQAVLNENTATVSVLLLHGARPDTRYEGATMLHWAILLFEDDTDMLETLLSHGLKPDMYDGDGKRPLEDAARRSKFDACNVLLRHGADPDVGDTLCYAVEENQIDLVAKMLRHGAHANCTARDGIDGMDTEGFRMLHVCVIKRAHADMYALLLQHGADINDKGYCDETPLMVAARYGYIDTAELLLRRGADVLCEDNDGANAIFVAAEHSHHELARLLLNHVMQQQRLLGRRQAQLMHPTKRMRVE